MTKAEYKTHREKMEGIRKKKKKLREEIFVKMTEMQSAGTLPETYKGYSLGEGKLILMNKRRKAELEKAST